MAYAHVAGRHRWPLALAAGLAGWLLTALVVALLLYWPVALLLALVTLVTVVALQLLPASGSAAGAARSRCWDVLPRMAAGTAVVVLVTAAAPMLGAGTRGLVAMLPIIGSVLAVSAQRADGAGAGIAIQRGILSGLLGTAAFLAVVAGSIERLGVVAALGLALLTVVAANVAALMVLRARSSASPVERIEPADAAGRPTLA